MACLSVVAHWNGLRRDLFQSTYDESVETKKRVYSWGVHKCVAIMSFPANLFDLGLSVSGFALSAATLGGLKVALFVLSMGKLRLDFPCGCRYFSSCGCSDVEQLFVTVGEILWDTGFFLRHSFSLIRAVGRVLFIEKFVFLLLHMGNEAGFFLLNRVKKGVQKAYFQEHSYVSLGEAPKLIAFVDNQTRKYRIDWDADQRMLSQVFAHFGLSIVNIPVNILAAAISLVVSSLTLSMFFSKIALYSVLPISLPISTLSKESLSCFYATSRSAIIDSLTILGDLVALVCKVSCKVGLNEGLSGFLGALLYIPEALYGTISPSG